MRKLSFCGRNGQDWHMHWYASDVVLYLRQIYCQHSAHPALLNSGVKVGQVRLPQPHAKQGKCIDHCNLATTCHHQ